MIFTKKEFSFKAVCLYPEIDPNCVGHLKKGRVYIVTESHYGGIGNKGQFLVNGWWFSALCFIEISEYRNKKISSLIDL